MPSDGRGSSSRKTGGGHYPETSRGHHRATDSGVGSLSDYDSITANPDRDYTTQPRHDYGGSSSSRHRLDMDRLRAANTQLEADKQALQVQYKEAKQHLREAQSRADKYKEDNKALLEKIHRWEEHSNRLKEDNDDLRRQLRGSPPRDPTAGPPARDSAPHIRRRDSKRVTPPRDLVEDDGMDQRLRDRLDGKTSDMASSTSGGSGHSGHSSGRTRRDSYVGSSHTGRPAVVVSVPHTSLPPSSSRSQTVYIPSSARTSSPLSPNQYASTPRTTMSPGFPGYAEPAYFDPVSQGGDYVHEPLPKERKR